MKMCAHIHGGHRYVNIKKLFVLMPFRYWKISKSIIFPLPYPHIILGGFSIVVKCFEGCILSDVNTLTLVRHVCIHCPLWFCFIEPLMVRLLVYMYIHSVSSTFLYWKCIYTCAVKCGFVLSTCWYFVGINVCTGYRFMP